MRWQNGMLTRLSSTSASNPASSSPARLPRFLVLRPGDKYTVCDATGMADVRAHCYRGAPPRGMQQPDGAHWDAYMLAGRRKGKMTRPIPGFGNVALSLVAAAATAIVSRRVLLLENFTSAGESFGSPLRDLLVETSGWMPHLRRASSQAALPARPTVDAVRNQGRSASISAVADGFAAHDDFSAFRVMCAGDLRRTPSARVWRIFSNQYFLPLLLLNPHHSMQMEAMAEPLEGGGGGESEGGADGAAASVPSLWTPGLRALWRPSPRLAARLATYTRKAALDTERYVAMHVRVNFADQRDGQQKLARAVACARSRLTAANASRLFLATMYASNRKALSSALGPLGVQVHWFGRAMEAQAESTAASDSALADMLLMGGAHEVLVTPGSTFGYVVQGLTGRRATIYGGTHTSRDLVGPAQTDCSAVATPEPNFHFLRHAINRYDECRRGAREAEKRGSTVYRLSAMKHRRRR